LLMFRMRKEHLPGKDNGGSICQAFEWIRCGVILYKPFTWAGVQGFEPQLADPESAVLPLNDTPMSSVRGMIP
jgi:hypothetical protein